MDFLASLVTDQVIAREVTVSGQTGTVHFKRLTAGQRAALLKGQKVATNAAGTATIDIDLGDNERQRLMMVQFCVVTPDGKPRYKLAEVEALPSHIVNVLYTHVTAINQDEEPGKA